MPRPIAPKITASTPSTMATGHRQNAAAAMIPSTKDATPMPLLGSGGTPPQPTGAPPAYPACG
ncbi:hypothetical protein ACFQV4_31515 [Streptomyces thermocarboxydus]